MQLRNESDDNSSPTVSTTSVFTIAAIAARECRNVATVYISGAYLKAPNGQYGGTYEDGQIGVVRVGAIEQGLREISI